ncbi:hypothetical protein ABS71_22040 [bacterium SCN 62-11]|nr:MAG: hypothetical protein ABS71_22040 [bacterium SCN 62-11]
MRTTSALARVFLVLAPLASLWVAWVMHPPVADPAALQAVLDTASQRREALYLRARDPGQNGALHPEFASWWRAKGSSAPLDAFLENWTRYSSQNQERLLDHRALQSDPHYRKSRKDFQALVPDLEEALLKPVFCSTSPAFQDHLRMLVLKKLTLGLQALAEDQLSQGHPEQAIRSVYPVLALSHHYFDHELGMEHLLANSFLNYGCETLLHILDSQDIKPEAWIFLKDKLPAVLPSPSALAYTLAGEMLFMREHSSDPPIGTVSWTERVIHFLPGLDRREHRMMDNFMVRAYQAAARDELPQIRQAPFQMTEWALGKSGYYESQFSINVDATARLTARHRRILAAIYLFACLKEYQFRHHRYPANLNFVSAPCEFQYIPGKLLSVQLPAHNYRRTPVYPPERKIHLGPTSLEFDLSP